MQCNPCVNDVIVEKLLHRDNPTLAPLKVRNQWHKDILTSGLILLVSSAKFTGTDFAFIWVSKSLARQPAKVTELYLPKLCPWSRGAEGVLSLA